MTFFMVWNKKTQDFIRMGTSVYVQGLYKAEGGPRVYTRKSDAQRSLNVISKSHRIDITSDDLEIIEFLPTFQNPSLDFMSWYSGRE